MTTDPLDTAGRLSAAMREMSDLLTGAVATLVQEGWSEEQARDLVVATYVANKQGPK